MWRHVKNARKWSFIAQSAESGSAKVFASGFKKTRKKFADSFIIHRRILRYGPAITVYQANKKGKYHKEPALFYGAFIFLKSIPSHCIKQFPLCSTSTSNLTFKMVSHTKMAVLVWRVRGPAKTLEWPFANAIKMITYRCNIPSSKIIFKRILRLWIPDLLNARRRKRQCE